MEDSFRKWLEGYGCEILPPTNQYESIRWKGKEVGVIYTSNKTNGKYANEAIKAFYSKKNNWTGGPIKTGRQNTYKKQKTKLLVRDGSKCFLCHTELGEDITVDHLIPLVQGGKNELSNMVLMHEQCNFDCGCKTVVEKVKMSVDNKIKIMLEFYTLKPTHKQ